ncbi:flagellar hook-basal body complex protein FliE [Aurantivibrio plasticivorans]
MTDRIDINRFLTEMRSIKSQTQAFGRQDGMASKDVTAANNAYQSLVGKPEPVNKTGFGEIMSNAIDKVNDTQQASASLAKAYEQGDPTVDITEVMIAAQKSSVSFQAMVQVRNKLVEAYRDVMNMPI